MVYADTSVLVAAFGHESATEAAKDALEESAVLCGSHWTLTEFASALSLKERSGQIDSRTCRTMRATFSRLVAESFTLLPVAPGHFLAAASYCERDGCRLRAGDALHLAVARDAGATLLTLDRVFHAEAMAQGATSRLL